MARTVTEESHIFSCRRPLCPPPPPLVPLGVSMWHCQVVTSLGVPQQHTGLGPTQGRMGCVV